MIPYFYSYCTLGILFTGDIHRHLEERRTLADNIKCDFIGHKMTSFLFIEHLNKRCAKWSCRFVEFPWSVGKCKNYVVMD